MNFTTCIAWQFFVTFDWKKLTQRLHHTKQIYKGLLVDIDNNAKYLTAICQKAPEACVRDHFCDSILKIFSFWQQQIFSQHDTQPWVYYAAESWNCMCVDKTTDTSDLFLTTNRKPLAQSLEKLIGPKGVVVSSTLIGPFRGSIFLSSKDSPWRVRPPRSQPNVCHLFIQILLPPWAELEHKLSNAKIRKLIYGS